MAVASSTALMLIGLLCNGPAQQCDVPRGSEAAEASPQIADSPVHRGSKLRTAGWATTGTGALLAVVGFSTFAGIHVGNPGPGLSLEGPDGSERHTLAAANAMVTVGVMGVSLIAAGVVLLGVDHAKTKRARDNGRPEITFVGSGVVGRF